MPIHDWTRVSAGTFHDFHATWIIEIKRVLNTGVLPPDYYAMAEQVAGGVGPDVLALQMIQPGANSLSESPAGGLAVATAPPRMRYTTTFDIDVYATKKKNIIIRHGSGDRIVAVVEIVSPGNKSSHYALRSFVDKAGALLFSGCHLLLADLFPPGPRDPQGIPGVLEQEFLGDLGFALPPEKPLTLAAYAAGAVKHAYVEPVAVGDLLPEMPLFLTPDVYVLVPLEKTYQAAWESEPRRWRAVLEGTGNPD